MRRGIVEVERLLLPGDARAVEKRLLRHPGIEHAKVSR